MKEQLRQFIRNALEAAVAAGDLREAAFPDIEIDAPKLAAHGDFATNVAMQMAKSQKTAPRRIAEIIVSHLPVENRWIDKCDIAGPGFINFYMRPEAWLPLLKQIHEADTNYGSCNIGQGQKIQVEFVSANPTGPLHVGHGRGAAVGDTVGNILSACGYDVQKEYYINDSGRQIRTLGRSVMLRLCELQGEAVDFPDECYQGDYIRELASTLLAREGSAVLDGSEDQVADRCARFAADCILDGIREDLDRFGVRFDRWFSEQSLYDDGAVAKVISTYQEQGIIYQQDGALWFNTTRFGDEKDRVVVRQDGRTTYFASDIAYHEEKYQRGFNRVIDVWGADHHGYIPRVTAAIVAGGRKAEQFHVILVRLVNLLRGGQPVAMSTRAGEFETLRDVVTEVGVDAARFIFLTRHYESDLDFDLEVATQQSNENPVYYVQYVHARTASILRKAAAMGVSDISWKDAAVGRLTTIEELGLIKRLVTYPEIVMQSARRLEPHRITFYLMDLAAAFHGYYNKHRVLTDDEVLTHGRLYLILAIQKVIRNGLTLLGVSAPERM